jgi:hypothetical protein
MNNAVTDERKVQESRCVETKVCASLDLDADDVHEVGLKDMRPKKPALIAVNIWDGMNEDDQVEKS